MFWRLLKETVKEEWKSLLLYIILIILSMLLVRSCAMSSISDVADTVYTDMKNDFGSWEKSKGKNIYRKRNIIVDLDRKTIEIDDSIYNLGLIEMVNFNELINMKNEEKMKKMLKEYNG